MKEQLEKLIDAGLLNAEKTEENGVTHYTVGKVMLSPWTESDDWLLASPKDKAIIELLEALKELREASMAENDGFSINLEFAMDGADEMITKHGEKS